MSTWEVVGAKHATVAPKLGGHYRALNGNTGECITVDDRIAVLEFTIGGKREAQRYGLSGLSLLGESWDLVACAAPPKAAK